MIASMENRLGELIKRRRGELGITQQMLADAVGMDRAYLSQVEAGNRKWPQKYIGGIANALGMMPSDLAVAAGKITAMSTGRDLDVAMLATSTPLHDLELARTLVERVVITRNEEDDGFVLTIDDEVNPSHEIDPLMNVVLGILRTRDDEHEFGVVFEANLLSLIADYFVLLMMAARKPEDSKRVEVAERFKSRLLNLISNLEAIQSLDFRLDPLGHVSSQPFKEIRSASGMRIKGSG